jgi:hypothetical protein
MVLFFISQDPLSLQKPENRGNLDQPQATVVFLDAAKKRKSNVFECSASPTPRDPKRMGFSHDFFIKQNASLVGREGEISGESRGSSGDWV